MICAASSYALMAMLRMIQMAMAMAMAMIPAAAKP
jgi:hypothetical protein